MAGNSTISIAFKLDGDDRGFRELAKSADGLRAAMTGSLSVADRLSSSLVNFAALSQGIQAASKAFSQLEGAMRGLTDAYAVQQAAETKLQQVMQNRMGATLDEVEAVKALAAEQQELGVISDEVQLAGAQQMAAYLGQKDSIETLLPAMNDLLAQQEGLNATTGSAEAVAKAMGKAMEGQVGSLQRLGVTFTDAEARVMQFGTEEERTAVLADVIESSVGGMNAALAQTDSGKQAQLANRLGDIREHLGAMVTGYMPFVTMAAQAGQAASSVATLASGFVTLTKNVIAGTVAFAKHTAAIVKNTAVTVAQRVASLAVAAATKVWSAVQVVLNAVMTANPLGIIIMAITALIAAVVTAYKRCDGFREVCQKVWEVIKKVASVIWDALVAAFEAVVGAVKAAWDWVKKFLGIGKNKVEVVLDFSGQEGWDEEADSIEGVRRNIEILQSMMEGASEAEQKELKKLIKEWQRKEKQIERANARVAEGAEAWDADALSINEVRDRLNKLQDRFDAATTQAERAEIQKLIDRYKALEAEYSAAGKAAADTDKAWHEECLSLNDVSDNLEILKARLNAATTDEARAEINALIADHERLETAMKSAGKSSADTSKTWHEECLSLNDVNENLDILRERYNAAASDMERAKWAEQIQVFEDMSEAMKRTGDEMESGSRKWDEGATTLRGINDNVAILNERLQDATAEEAAYINRSIAEWNAKADAIKNAGKVEERAVTSASDAMRKGYSETKNLAGGIESISDALTDSSSVWDMITGVIDGFLQIFDSFSAIIEIIRSLTAATEAQAVAQEVTAGVAVASSTEQAAAAGVQAGADIAEGIAAESAANGLTTLAAAEIMAAHAEIPFVGIPLATGFTEMMMATLLSLPKLAKGGLAGGPTLALVGEYSGASTNPEVIAPLDRLRSMLRTDDDRYGQVEFRIEGRTLVGVLQKVNNLNDRR